MKTVNNPFNVKSSEGRFKSARANLLIVVVLTAINLVLAFFPDGMYFMFSAYLPYVLMVWGLMFCGLYPAEVLNELGIANPMPKPVFAVFAGAAVLILLIYLFAWIFSKKNRVGWLIAALVCFVIDTVILVIIGFDPGRVFGSVINIVFHIWVIVSLILGIVAHFKLKKAAKKAAADKAAEKSAEKSSAPETVDGSIPAWSGEAGAVLTEENVSGGAPAEAVDWKKREESANSPVLRFADEDVKSRVFLETVVLGHTVTYRRAGKVNELVIDGKVYDETVPAFIETAHTLTARVDGHVFEAGFDGVSSSFIDVDGENVERKLRVF